MLPTLETGPLVQAVGWALFHSAWQLLVIAALLWGTLALLRSSTALTRYWVSVAALLCGAILPVLTTLGVLARLGEPGARATGLSGALPWVSWLPAADTQSGAAGALATGGLLSERVAAILPTLTVLWLVVVTVLSARLVMGWTSVQRLRRQRTRRLPTHLTRRFYRVARGLGVRGVRFLESRAVDVPMVVGWLSPIVLIPAAVVLRLSPQELESVVAHELAHVRRRDYLVNLIQTVVETVLFFHPAVWWISKRIREERECCCDDTAVSTCGDALAYARALTELESLRAGLPRLALGATGGVLLERVRRLVRPEASRSASTRRDLGGLVVLLSTTALFVGTGLSVGAPTVEEPAPVPEPRVVAAFVMLAGDVGKLTGEEHSGLNARFKLRLGPDDLRERGLLLDGGAEQYEFKETIHVGTGGEFEVMRSILASSDEHEINFAGNQKLKTVMLFSKGDEPLGGMDKQLWSAKLTADFVDGSHLELSDELPDELPEELREHLERLLEDEQFPNVESGFRELILLHADSVEPGS